MSVSLRTLRCFDTCGCCNPSRWAISPTVRGPSRKSSTMCKRFGSVRAVHVVFIVLLYPKRNILVKVYSFLGIFWPITKARSGNIDELQNRPFVETHYPTNLSPWRITTVSVRLSLDE